MRVRYFREEDASRWDAFCLESHGATFLHSRRFLSYHGNRFFDRSLIIENDTGWLGLLPAAVTPEASSQVCSHPGLTYGGLLHCGQLAGEACVTALRLACHHYAESGHSELLYKAVPHIYHRSPAQDDLWALFRLDAKRQRCDLSSCIDLAHPLAVSERRRRAQKKAQRAGLSLDHGHHCAAELWALLEENLRRHHTRPVHRLDEIELLSQRFPLNIRFCLARQEKEALAGAVLFVTPTVTHTQYIASSEQGRQVAALDWLFDQEIRHARSIDTRFFDFGISNEDQGRTLNQGLHRFKSEFGAGGLVHEFYTLDLHTR